MSYQFCVGLVRCPACGYWAFNGIECFDCGYRVAGCCEARKS
jgi:DNA-directed RNA polymerase subunit RPC12/RpoP